MPSVLNTPLYTISGRHKVPIDDRMKVPGPGNYSPEKLVLLCSPSYSFGIKIHTDKYGDVPGMCNHLLSIEFISVSLTIFYFYIGPNAYRIPSVLDTPMYTISGRHKVPLDDRVKVPAPNAYCPEKVSI
jgi:hypothetical protein